MPCGRAETLVIGHWLLIGPPQPLIVIHDSPFGSGTGSSQSLPCRAGSNIRVPILESADLL